MQTCKQTCRYDRTGLYFSIMSTALQEIRQLPLGEKLQIMEVIWEDLRSRSDDVPVPSWHREILDDRRKAVEDGREKVLEWDQVKRDLGVEKP